MTRFPRQHAFLTGEEDAPDLIPFPLGLAFTIAVSVMAVAALLH